MRNWPFWVCFVDIRDALYIGIGWDLRWTAVIVSVAIGSVVKFIARWIRIVVSTMTIAENSSTWNNGTFAVVERNRTGGIRGTRGQWSRRSTMWRSKPEASRFTWAWRHWTRPREQCPWEWEAFVLAVTWVLDRLYTSSAVHSRKTNQSACFYRIWSTLRTNLHLKRMNSNWQFRILPFQLLVFRTQIFHLNIEIVHQLERWKRSSTLCGTLFDDNLLLFFVYVIETRIHDF